MFIFDMVWFFWSFYGYWKACVKIKYFMLTEKYTYFVSRLSCCGYLADCNKTKLSLNFYTSRLDQTTKVKKTGCTQHPIQAYTHFMEAVVHFNVFTNIHFLSETSGLATLYCQARQDKTSKVSHFKLWKEDTTWTWNDTFVDTLAAIAKQFLFQDLKKIVTWVKKSWEQCLLL